MTLEEIWEDEDRRYEPVLQEDWPDFHNGVLLIRPTGTRDCPTFELQDVQLKVTWDSEAPGDQDVWRFKKKLKKGKIP
jgi:hypothetical protein